MPIAVTVDGLVCNGYYAVQSNMLTVWHPDHGSRTDLLDDRPEQEVACAMLRELVADSQGSQGSQGEG